ncbi:trypsin-like peptidase domain-containing protein [Streptomyces sp. NBC_00124]|uniref:serine protease n=1 Tax=Streptomyces sp. NBC_00124 TaxID=2975662 RepID=UPI0022533A12|nr:serine protease [Streptomyces sp. NBC_00124]MCX5364401.1 trypsin-like peptidase domain-containing protein [Streptomyces sp. NBC_00124]
MTRSALVDALPDAVLALVGADGAEGTGFFVAPDLVLTCAHVVGAGGAPAEVAARWRGQDLTLTVVPEWFRPPGADGSGPDLALLRVPESLDHPVVCLATAMEPGDELWAYGHPQGRYRDGDSVTFTAQGPSRRSHDGGGSLALFHATHGRATPGFSGSPVLNWRTGAICGVLRFAHSLERGVPGARLVPVAELCAVYPFLDVPESVTGYRRDWLGLLDDDQLRGGGWRFPGPVLRAYLEAAREAARDHPYTIRVSGAGTPPLAKVYVSQQVAPEGEVGPHAGLGDTPLLPAESLLDVTQGTVLVGGPGTGKSSLGLRLTAQLAEAWLNGPAPEAVPVRVPAGVLAERGYFSDLLRTAVERDGSLRLRSRLPRDFFDRPPLPGVPWLVLVDGVDEVLDQEERQYVLQSVAAMWRSPDFHFLVTTRPLPRDDLKPLLGLKPLFFRIQPFGPDVLPGFAGQWFRSLERPDPDDLAEQFMQATVRGNMLHLAGIPLLATMLVVLFAEHPHSELPSSRIELYERFTARLLKKMHHRPTLAVDALRARVEGYPEAPEAVQELIKGVRGLVESIALHRQEYGPEVPAVDLAALETAALRPPYLPEDDWRDVLRALLLSTGLMVGEDDDLVFLHQTVQEFLAACVTARTIDPAGEAGARFMAGKVNESWEVHHFPEENAYLEFVFGLWAKQGKDAGGLVLNAFETPERRDDEERGPGQGTGLAARLLFTSTLPRRVLPQVIDRLRSTAMKHGCAWAAGAVAHEDADAGIALLVAMVTAPHLAAYQRLAAAWELAAWDWYRAVGLLQEIAARGMGFSEERTSARDTRGDTTHTAYFDVGPQVVVMSRIDAACMLGELDLELGLSALSDMASDESLPVGDRLRAAWALAEFDPEPRTLTAPPLVAGMDGAQALRAEVVLRAAEEDAPDDPGRLLTEWAQDRARTNGVRVLTALALALHDAEQGAVLLEELLTASGVGLDWEAEAVWAAEELLALDRARGVHGLSQWITEATFIGPDAVALLAEVDREAAASALKERIESRMSDSLDEVYMLAQLDREAGEAVLVEMFEDESAFWLEDRWEAARCLAAFNPQLALQLVRSAVASMPAGGDDGDLPHARRVLREIEAAAASAE